MSDASRQIVDGIIAALTGLASTGSRVSDSPEYPADPAGLPCLRVFDPEEAYEVTTLGVPRVYERRLQLQVHILATADAGLSATLDAIGLEVKTALAMPAICTAAPAIRQIALVRRSKTVDGSSERPIGRSVLTFETEFQTREDAPSVLL
jgi:hypothetical protein